MGFLSKLLSAGEGKPLKKYEQKVSQINELEPIYEAKTDEQLANTTQELRSQIEQGKTLDEILPEAFAAVREASKRTLGLRHFDVQLIGGMALHEGKIAEMKTGEGKTLVSTLAGYLNALPGNNVHIITVNDYLAARDSEWMGQIYKFLGMSVGLIQNGMSIEKKKPAYQADITYGTNSEFGFDYLRDNMVSRADSRVQRGRSFAIVDEVDSILIDEARTPLIISGIGSQAADTYKKFAAVMPSLKRDEDFEIDEAKKTIYPTETGLEKIEFQLGVDDIYADPNGQLPNHLQQALRAQFLFHRDVDYVVVGGEVKIVDEFTGRIMEGRRYSEGLHQALEAKEHVMIKQENQTLATITLQNYFRLYDKLSGMTGTALTEDSEFRQIYDLAVQVIPPNKPIIRDDKNDLIYRTIDAKFNAVADEIQERNAKGQPVLVGTVSIESSEKLSNLLTKRGIKHQILNAKNHEKEALIIAQAGRKGAVTIATNMAGRGTDILLGGNPDILAEQFLIETLGNDEEPSVSQIQEANKKAKSITTTEYQEVKNAGGLCVIGTERHDSRRIDNQLRGRSGRQGDPGVTQFYLSLEDDLMRLFGGTKMDTIANMMQKTDIPEDMPIQASMVSKAIENAQRQVETVNFSARKNILEYDDVMNLQRKAIYEERNAILDGKDLSQRTPSIIQDTVRIHVLKCCDPKSASDDWDVESLNQWLLQMTDDSDFVVEAIEHEDDVEILQEIICDVLQEKYDDKVNQVGNELMAEVQRQVMLRFIDTRWMSHLQEMDYLKTSIGLRAYGQRDPLTEYREEAHRIFKLLIDGIYEDYLRFLLRAPIVVQNTPQDNEKTPLDGKVSYSNPEDNLNKTGVNVSNQKQTKTKLNNAKTSTGISNQKQSSAKGNQKPKPVTYTKDKDDPYANCGRNDPCPCGSGKKFKKCHGANRA